ncbi:hypothetical protein [Pandoraea sp. B-6]|uniref:hypothetical protein n=1 Tax=Pandoraea sp. B-6 TaxID=1204340 RepID=UPI00036A6E14|nr:hypothetical protein [Pandoraea sp. B-6]
MNIRFVEDGNLSSWLRLLLILVGIAIAVAAIDLDLSVVWARALLLIGFAVALVGGMTSRAKLLKIKPFDSRYKKARNSYRSKQDDEDGS